MTDTGTAAQFTPADVLASVYARGAVLTDDQARDLTDRFAETPDDTGDGHALRVLASYWADQAMTVINARRADATLPASVLDWAAIGFGGSLDALIDAGVPAPDCAATEALLGEIQELIVRRLCAERAGLCAGGLNRILAALIAAGQADADRGQIAEADAHGRLADRIAGLLGASVAEPGGIGFTID